MSDHDTQSSSPVTQSEKPKGKHKTRFQAASDRVKELEVRALKLRNTLESVERAKAEKQKAIEELQKKSETPRKTVVKKKILIGAMIMRDMEADPKVHKQILARLDEFLERATDRAAFDLPARPAAAPTPADAQAAT